MGDLPKGVKGGTDEGERGFPILSIKDLCREVGLRAPLAARAFTALESAEVRVVCDFTGSGHDGGAVVETPERLGALGDFFECAARRGKILG